MKMLYIGRNIFCRYLDPRAAAAIGQGGLISLYEDMFNLCGVNVAQILVTQPDFENENNRLKTNLAIKGYSKL